MYGKNETKSNNECFNLCIQDPNCNIALKVSEYGLNCYLSNQLYEENETEILNAETISIKGNLDQYSIIW